MKSIPRFVAGTAVVLAAVLTTAPLTSGIADYVLNPGQSPVKRAFSQAFSASRTAVAKASVMEPAALTDQLSEADARVAELAADLQAGVDAGEYSQEDAARVLGDMAGYIRGERTWPERNISIA